MNLGTVFIWLRMRFNVDKPWTVRFAQRRWKMWTVSANVGGSEERLSFLKLTVQIFCLGLHVNTVHSFIPRQLASSVASKWFLSIVSSLRAPAEARSVNKPCGSDVPESRRLYCTAREITSLIVEFQHRRVSCCESHNARTVPLILTTGVHVIASYPQHRWT